MEKKLSVEQINHLYFTRQHYVEWYDLQSELVDHLKERDRNAMAGKPEITLTKSLNTEFKKFGVFGFMDVVEKRQAVLSKKV
jgi:desulfoferrodoxin (superoxide reductase-like protein)